MKSPSEAELEAGRRLLRRLLPRAIKDVKDGIYRADTTNLMSDALATNITLDNLDAIIIHEGEADGYLAELTFKDMPPGFPVALGTPVEEPHGSRQVAQDSAFGLLGTVIAMIFQAEGKPKQPPQFIYHDWVVGLMPELLDALINRGIRNSLGMDEAFRRLRDFDIKHPAVSKDDIHRLEESSRKLLFTRIHMAAALGIFRYPEIKAKAPAQRGKSS
jgi:hypothetical protein